MLKLIIGLGNPTDAYKNTRHNAGFWFVEQLADTLNVNLSFDKKYNALTARTTINGVDMRLLLPQTYMNKSGDSVAPFAKFFNIQAHEILVAHDELDIGIGEIRLKTGGGHGGHNGLKDIVPHIGAEFHRLRIGIGRPIHGNVSNFVLGTPPADDKIAIQRAIDCAIDNLPLIIAGNLDKARNNINGFKLPE